MNVNNKLLSLIKGATGDLKSLNAGSAMVYLYIIYKTTSKEGRLITVKGMMEHVGITKMSVYNILADLTAKGFITKPVAIRGKGILTKGLK